MTKTTVQEQATTATNNTTVNVEVTTLYEIPPIAHQIAFTYWRRIVRERLYLLG